MAIIETHDVTKIYNQEQVPVHALNGVTLNIEEGEFTSIVGPSGSGKTTLLNMIGGLDKPTSGKVVVNGIDLFAMKENDLINFRLQHIGFVFQAYNLIPVLTAKENVSFILQMQGKKAAEYETRSMDLLKAVGLEDKVDKRPSELSGGQQQRVAVARALASKPDFVLADEPTANLDSVSSGNLLDMMLHLNEEENITFIFSTHDQRVVDRARRVVTLVDGKVDKDEKR
ncbi:ABC transporter ATP-binding protein [Aliifodinibius salicampi]|uniref:ABC transporter ATP-binding protein n=1 Tax=Fodinibius salicampi TaxID=1920655 RepID=A0ABT3Q1K6_9BACT|nr:ABC transporter ATP-binding protein [Fodinibius salicampi]MCW9713985.1 ABC transporter ATP-binding protein [Fodinibius salicampi]